MSINLSKSGIVNLAKEAPGVTKFALAIGWDENKGQSEFDFDPDVTLFVCNKDGKCLTEKHMIFYNSPTDPEGAVVHSGDDRTGGSSDGDDETITIDSSKLHADAAILKGVITIHEAKLRKQNFSMMENAFARLYEVESGREVCKYNLSADGGTAIAMHFVDLRVKDDKTLDFVAVGEASDKALADYCREAGLQVG